MKPLGSNKGGGQEVFAIVAIICIALCGFLIVKRAGTHHEQPLGRSYYYCTNCEKEFTGSSSLVPPIKCPFCKQPTGVYLRKYKCNKCGHVFRGYIEKYDMETKGLIEKRRQGQKVPDEQIGSVLVTEPDTDDWVDASTQEAFDIFDNIACPKCGASGGDVEAVFPKPENK